LAAFFISGGVGSPGQIPDSPAGFLKQVEEPRVAPTDIAAGGDDDFLTAINQKAFLFSSAMYCREAQAYCWIQS
jgi:hypothetical protein